MNELVKNISSLHTTEMGEERIKKNVAPKCNDVVEWCRKAITDKSVVIERKGKNWYVYVNDIVITVNASSYTIITAHRKK